jgi:hypothetical protein
VTVDEARHILRNHTRYDYGTVQRAMRVIEQDANDRWGSGEVVRDDAS